MNYTPLSVLPCPFKRISSSHQKAGQYFLIFVFIISTLGTGKKGRKKFKCSFPNGRDQWQGWNLTSVLSQRLLCGLWVAHRVALGEHLEVCASPQQEVLTGSHWR